MQMNLQREQTQTPISFRYPKVFSFVLPRLKYFSPLSFSLSLSLSLSFTLSLSLFFSLSLSLSLSHSLTLSLSHSLSLSDINSNKQPCFRCFPSLLFVLPPRQKLKEKGQNPPRLKYFSPLFFSLFLSLFLSLSLSLSLPPSLSLSLSLSIPLSFRYKHQKATLL